MTCCLPSVWSTTPWARLRLDPCGSRLPWLLAHSRHSSVRQAQDFFAAERYSSSA